MPSRFERGLPAENLSPPEDESVRPTQLGDCLKANYRVRLTVIIRHYNPLDMFAFCSCKVYSLKGSGGKPARKKPLGKSRRRWEGNIKKGHPVKDGSRVNLICLDQDRDKWCGLL